ncbi:hypothetical protein K505DRAFT_324909 [Melanomma pulvis-pyrius CBS 109.77]|uniref:Zn(2)-C6 fungal-type domain-containing protein n=1 Tax=Melanomma pulvis-pyrius CBS 109.77 TaxID=1314802 RepID=A0A6A6XCJ5_9PLEO|nr:hypothetical protein K505DRAFT_324909 [Melanomma pulvis-pyrius CBS 109.77]
MRRHVEDISRHKSCLACIHTKRKCDQTWPRCQRCVARGSECQYIGRKRHQPQRSTNSDVDQSVPVVEPSRGQTSSNLQLQQYHAEPMSLFTTCPDDALFEFPNHPFSLGSMSGDDTFILDSIQNNVPEQVLSSADPNVRDITSDARLQARVEFVATRLATIPRTFAEQGQTMFIHRMQFQQRRPSALQDAMSACALYCMKGVANQTLVFRNLEHRCQELIARTNALNASKTDLLAALQALLLYQMMRLFDGDIRLRAQAEADEPIAILWASQLRAHMCNAAQATLAASGLTDTSIVAIDCRSDWQSWLLDESTRRTVITAFMLKGVYSFLKLGYDSPTELRVYFTAQAALWGAQSDVGWRRAQEERERLEIRVTHWEEAMAKAKPIDLEELGVLIMTMLWGLQTTRTWLGREFTVKYGLETT